jgi:hypothetical protein
MESSVFNLDKIFIQHEIDIIMEFIEFGMMRCWYLS